MTLNGIDISKWQKGLDLSKIKCDFVIVKATEGIGYVDPECDRFYQKAKSLGKKLGFYHFARPSNNAVKEAQYFYQQTKNYFHEAIPVLDWEYKPTSNVAWANAWLDEVYRLSGVRPMIYMSESVVNANEWSAVVKGNYGLWVARYRDNNPDYNYDMTNAGKKPSVRWWSGYAMWQWTSSGRLNGYSGNLDCDVFYGDATAWDKYAGKKTTSTSKPVTTAKTPESFVKAYTGKAIDDDGAYGVQCIDGMRILCKYIGIPAVITPSNWADGYWTCKNPNGTINQNTKAWQEKYFDKITGSKNFRNGDIVIWGRKSIAGGSSSHPNSHVALYFDGKEFGENQGGNRGFCLKSTDFSDAMGALRPKVWADVAKTKILFVGNSYTYKPSDKESLPIQFETVCKNHNLDIDAVMIAEGGWTFERHWNNSATITALKSKKYKIVILQGQSDEVGCKTGEMSLSAKTYGKKLADLAKQYGASVYFLAQADYYFRLNDGKKTMFNMKYQTNVDANLKTLGYPVCYGGKKVKEVAKGKYDPYFESDGYHPTALAQKVIAEVIYETLYKPQKPSNPLDKYSDDELALKVILGEYGNGDKRKKALGDRYTAVQKKVDALMKKKSLSAVADEVISGKWGTGETRRKALTKAGYNYSAVQKIVNQKMAKR